MNWPDEHYIKFYTRDTLTWHTWRWETRCVFALLLRKVDGAGIIETGIMGVPQALALQLGVPSDLTTVAVEQLLADGTCQAIKGGLLIPHFLEAQEAKRSEAVKKREQRDSERSRRRLDAATAQTTETPRPVVPICPGVSPDVPPSPAQPSPALSKNMSTKVDPGLRVVPDPGLLEFVAEMEATVTASEQLDEKLTRDEYDVFEHWRTVMQKHPRRTLALPSRKRLLAKWLAVYSKADLQAAIDGCARTPWNMGENPSHKKYNSLELILRDAEHIEAFIEAARGSHA